MDYKIVNKQIFADRFKRLDIHCPQVARKAKAGQFVKICPAEGEVSIPLTVFETDPQRGIISLIVHETDPAAQRLGLMPINEPVYSVLGPLGVPTPVERKGVVVCIATGVGIGRILPVARALKQLGNKVIGIIGARTKRELLLEAQMRIACHKIFAATDDGSHEHRGLATDVFRRLLGEQGQQGQPPLRGVYAAGSVEMMETVCELTRPLEIETYVVLDTAMVDCLGLCGACRVVVAGRTVQACVDGPTFDGHKVDFNDLKIRVNAFKEKDRWGNQQLASSPKGNESGILTKFLAGYPKS
ncbi:MAG: sulfide/dihydroorotate dehydrogenase-like FAD/NAD-binding protein [Candidatus Omnitrophica bacterium]|nr:sulfide/dihydroorotate dehydrogenase-like FAD/NAD-binding protein [Candidatus Omnitrophota bacterium]